MRTPRIPRAMWAPRVHTEIEALVRAEQIRMLFRQLPRTFIGTVAGGAVLSVALWVTQHAPWKITLWFAAVVLVQVARLALYFYDRRVSLVDKNPERAALYWTCGTFSSGLVLGAVAFLFYASGHDAVQVLLTVTVFAAATAAVPMIGSHMPAFYAFLVPAVTPLIVRNAMEGDVLHVAIAVTTVMMLVAYLSFGRVYNRMLVESLHDRFENELLAEKLAAQNVDLEAARVQAENANRAKTQFFAAASHDLRQPLHAMGLFASALADKIKYPEVASIVTSINASVHALEALFNELLDISKLDSGAIKPRLAGFAIQDVLCKLRNEFKVEAGAKQVGLDISDEAHVIESDPVLLERILRNLVSNALRYTPTGGHVTLKLAREGNEVHIAVTDTGIGIPPEHQQRIFEEFYQVGNPGRTSKKGLGLGLSIVQRMSELLGYRMQVQSEPNKGSTFSFAVPVGELPQQEAPAPRHAPAKPTDLNGKLVVVVDDEEAIVDGMKALLTGWGAQVIGSTTGHDVLDAVLATGRLPDLLIVDYRLGNGDIGLDVARTLRNELDPEIPAILVTGSITPDLGEQARAANFEFLLKPVLPENLRAAIYTALGQWPAPVSDVRAA